jgi:myo-inositol 2-dehydrogenase/D-chiro-inositol 1-dehydrogenase
VGFIGAGFIAGVHAGILARDERVQLAQVFDPIPHQSALFALRHGVTTAPSLDDLLGGVDAVYICSPNAFHAGTAIRALDAGLHVFSEKPMATSLDDAVRVRDAAKQASGVYQAGFNRRFAPVYVEMKRRLDAGDITPTSALLKMNRGELQRPAWTGDPMISGGFLYETPVHMLDLIRHLFGEPTDIVVRGRATVYEQMDDFSMLFTFPSGLSAVFATSAHTTWLFPFERIEIYGEHAIAATEEMERMTFARGIGQPSQTRDYSQLPFEERWGYVDENRLFVNAVLGSGAPAVSAGDAYGTTALVDRCDRLAAGDLTAAPSIGGSERV